MTKNAQQQKTQHNKNLLCIYFKMISTTNVVLPIWYGTITQISFAQLRYQLEYIIQVAIISFRHNNCGHWYKLL